MAGSEIFVDPNEVKNCASKIKGYAGDIKECLNEAAGKMRSTEQNFQSQAASDMRDKFEAMKADFDKFENYLNKVASYLTQNVAEPVTAINAAAVKNVASIKKPKG